MPKIISVGTGIPDYAIPQTQAMEFARQLFSETIPQLDRLLSVFENGEIKKRHLVKELDWYRSNHTFSEKNDIYIKAAEELSIQAIKNCLASPLFKREVTFNEIDAIFMVSSTGLATPSLEARIINKLPFSEHTKRIPIWGLGCAGGAAGLARAYEYCLAFPAAKVLVVAVELCSITFQKDDYSKSNLIGTSLFADGAAATLVIGKEVEMTEFYDGCAPTIVGVESTLMKNSLDVMGWDIKENGLYVIFSKSIPSIIHDWFKPVMGQFIKKHHVEMQNIRHFILHPGGKKVIEAYEKAFGLTKDDINLTLKVLQDFGNMSSPTVLFVLQKFLEQRNDKNSEYGIIGALGPGFSSELLLVKWES